ncbi:DUF3470 domain-containing protein [Mesorhizobium sp. SB112]|uniref:ferredoxin family protein n=1 Tax=Mesorhizobium sp. SB112 TaxID=3151853 RepID=UPI00326478AB
MAHSSQEDAPTTLLEAVPTNRKADQETCQGGLGMANAVTGICISCKKMDFANVWAVDCFYDGENILVIHPRKSADCRILEPECPAEALPPDSAPDAAQWLKLNARFSANRPNISISKSPPSDAAAFIGQPDKLNHFLSESPGDGNI